MKIKSINTYPIKGLSPQSQEAIDVTANEALPGDRQYAIENGTRDFDAVEPRYFAKAKFLQVMSHEQLAALTTSFDAKTTTLTILRNGKQVARGNLSLPVGRQMIEQFLAAYMGSSVRGAPRIVSAPGHHFCDVPDNFISLINLATVADLQRLTGQPVDPLRFRGNLYVEGPEPWQELQWLGKTVSLQGKGLFRVCERISRCAAINVDPATGERNMSLTRTLPDVFGHEDCGLYLKALDSARLTIGDELTIVSS